MNKAPNTSISPNQARYNQARHSILLIIIFSIINIFTLSFGNTYFLFSSYFTAVVADTGAYLAQETGLQLYLYAAIAISIISVIPYLFCWIFAKKHYGWMIAALVLISADSALLAYDLIWTIMDGFAEDATSYIIDVIFHAFMIYSLAVGVKFGKHLKSDSENPAPQAAQEELLSDSANDYADEGMGDITRTVTVIRPKKFTGCAINLVCQIDGINVFNIKNGQTVSHTVNGNSHKLTVFNPANRTVSEAMLIPSGYDAKNYALELKNDMTIGIVVNIIESNQ